MSDLSSRSIDETANLYDFLTLFLDHRARGEGRELAWYLSRFPGDDAGLAREYLALVEAQEARPDGLFADRYEILRELGRGGQGVVSLARDTLLDRHVALKIIETFGRRVERLRREAEIASSLDHPDICPIYEANFAHSPAYVAMRYIEGATLSQLLAQRREGLGKEGSVCGDLPVLPRTGDELDRVLATIERAARALHAAHETGIVHRDIKPANLIITPGGDPVLLDFGLASHDDSEALQITVTGEAVGTPAYMSPEQIRGEERLDRTTDVYALGVTLYECLTLCRPFDGLSRSAVERAALNDSAVRPSALNKALPSEIDAVISVALDSDKSRRYATAELFADDLRRIRTRQPILAVPAGSLRRTTRWVQRNPRVAGALVVLSVLLVLVGFLYSEVERRGEAQLVELLTREAIEYGPSKPGYAYAVASEAYALSPNTLGTNDALLQSLVLHGGLLNLGSYNESAIDLEEQFAVTARGTELLVRDATTWELITTVETGAQVERGDLSPDGRRVLVGDLAGRVTLWDLESRQEISHIAPSDAAISLVRCLWASGRVFAGDTEGRVFSWSLAGDEALTELHDYAAAVSNLSLLSPDGAHFVSFSAVGSDGSAYGTAHVWDTADGRLVHTLRGHSAFIANAAISSSGLWLATASEDKTARVWDLQSGVCLATLEHPGKVLCVDFGHDGKQLAVSCDPGDLAVESGERAFLWDWSEAADAPRLALPQGGSRSTYAIAHNPAGDVVATGQLDGTVVLWNSRTGEEIDRCKTDCAIWRLRWKQDGTQLLITGLGPSYAWRLERPAPRRLLGHGGPVLGARFSPDGARALTVSADKTAKIWNVANGRCLQTLPHDDVVRWGEFSPDGSVALTGCDDGNAWLWREGQRIARFGPHTGGVTHCRFLDDARVLTGTDAGELRLWDTEGNLLRDWVGHVGPIQQVRVGPRGELVVSGGSDRSARVWSPDQDEPTLIIDDWDYTRANDSQTRVFDIAFSPDGRGLTTVGEDSSLLRVSLPEGEVISQECDGIFGKVVELPGGQLVSTRKWSGWYTYFSPSFSPSFSPTIEPAGASGEIHTSLITHLAVSPQGFVLTTSADTTGYLLRLEDGLLIPHMRLVGHDGQVTHGAFSPDGQTVITASLDGTARLWPVHPVNCGLVPRDLTERERADLGL
ncbi:MAG: WD40 repeat protein/serine/threonine protein kinase [Pseudohongiellaceae bacterium]|jgi:WD40 repeat protein/serine/threonine protein kinase